MKNIWICLICIFLMLSSAYAYRGNYGSRGGQFGFWLGTGTALNINDDDMIFIHLYQNDVYIKTYSVPMPGTRFFFPISARASYTLAMGLGGDVFAGFYKEFCGSWTAEIGGALSYEMRFGGYRSPFSGGVRLGGGYLWAKDVMGEASDEDITFSIASGAFGGFGEVGVTFQAFVPIRVALGYKYFSSEDSPKFSADGFENDYTVIQLPVDWKINSSGPYISLEVKLLPIARSRRRW